MEHYSLETTLVFSLSIGHGELYTISQEICLKFLFVQIKNTVLLISKKQSVYKMQSNDSKYV